MAKPPRLDDAHWVPLLKTALELRERTGSLRLAISDLTEAMRAGKLASMRRHERSGEAERLDPSFWRDHEFDVHVHGWVTIYRRTPRSMVTGHVYAVWQGDDADDGEPLRAIDRAKAVLVELYPSKVQVPGSLKAATGAVAHECGKRGWEPPSTDTVVRALEDLGYRAARKR